MMTRYLMIAGLAIAALTASTVMAWTMMPQVNHAPVVKIQSPAPNAAVSSGSPVRYEISVADKEDGDSRYEEINPREVVLEIRTGTPAKSAAPKGASSGAASGGMQPSPLEAPGLAVMARSNCFNCHPFNGKLIGPSLTDIAKRYPATAAITDTLTRRIKEGSAGIWGKEKMPSHPEVNVEDIRRMVQWIQKYAAAPGVTYQNGTTGVLQFPGIASPGATSTGAAKPGVYTLTAAYTDHGIKDTKDTPGHYLTGLDHSTLTVR
jgi:cytochrome c